MAKREPAIVASREEAIQKSYAAGLKHLHRPNNPSDPYYTTEAVYAYAVQTADKFLRNGTVVIDVRA